MPDFRVRLAALGLSQVELRRWVEAITGHRLAPTTTSRWAKGHRSLSPEMDALLAIIEDPELLQDLKHHNDETRQRLLSRLSTKDAAKALKA